MTKFKNQFNYQNSEDLLPQLLELDKEFQASSNHSYQTYLSKHKAKFPQTNFFTTAKNTYLNIVHTITKNAVIATVMMLVALTGVSASAAQLLAPVEFKPTTIANKILQAETQKEPKIEPLVADENHDVVVIEECDLALKVKKDSFDLPAQYGLESNDNSLAGLFNKINNYSYSSAKLSFKVDSGHGYPFSCYLSKNQQLPDTEQIETETGEINKKVSTDYLQQFNLTNSSTNLVTKVFDSSCCAVVGASFNIKNNPNTYIIQIDRGNEAMSNISQIQINSLAPSVPTLKLEEIGKKDDSNNLQGTKFIGKIGNSEVEMFLNFNGSEIEGSYFYKSQNKPIDLKGRFDGGIGQNALGALYLEERVDGQKTGEFNNIGQPENAILVADYPNKLNEIKGIWTNSKTGEKLNFELHKEGSSSSSKKSGYDYLAALGQGEFKTFENQQMEAVNLNIENKNILSMSPGACTTPNVETKPDLSVVKDCQTVFAYPDTFEQFSKLNLKAFDKVNLTAKMEKIKIPSSIGEDLFFSWKIVELIKVEKNPEIKQNPEVEFEDIIKFTVVGGQGLCIFDSETNKYSIECEKSKQFEPFYNGNGQLKIFGKRRDLNSLTNGKIYYQITQVSKVEKISQSSSSISSSSSSASSANIVTLDNQEMTLDSIGVISYRFWFNIHEGKQALLFAYSEGNNVDTFGIPDLNNRMKDAKIGDKFLISGKIKILNDVDISQSSEFIEITKLENTSKSNQSELSNDVLEAMIGNGWCYTDPSQIGKVYAGQIATCEFAIKNQDIRNSKKEIRAEVVAFSEGVSTPCTIEAATLFCRNIKIKSNSNSSRSDIALFFGGENFGRIHGDVEYFNSQTFSKSPTITLKIQDIVEDKIYGYGPSYWGTEDIYFYGIVNANPNFKTKYKIGNVINFEYDYTASGGNYVTIFNGKKLMVNYNIALKDKTGDSIKPGMFLPEKTPAIYYP